MIDHISSPIYDICKYSDLVNSEAVLTGTRQIPAGQEIERGRNDYFVLDAGWYDSDGNPIRRSCALTCSTRARISAPTPARTPSPTAYAKSSRSTAAL